MKKLLRKYKDCDMFSLSERYSYFDLDTQEYRYYNLNDDECDIVIRRLEEETYNRLLELYLEYDYEDDFDEVYQDIKNECIMANNRFIVDAAVNGETKYKCDGPIWMMYHDINHMVFAKRNLIELTKDSKVYELSDLFETEEYKALSDSIITSEIKFNNHCTTGPLFRTYYFDFNNVTKRWLSNRKDVFDFRDGLEDLAFYKDGTLVYSTCTHEEYAIEIEAEVEE